MSLVRVHEEFIMEADRLRRLVAISAMTVQQAKRRMHEIANDLIDDELETRLDEMRRSVDHKVLTDEL